jgi:hypothetical protein
VIVTEVEDDNVISYFGVVGGVHVRSYVPL